MRQFAKQARLDASWSAGRESGPGKGYRLSAAQVHAGVLSDKAGIWRARGATADRRAAR
jgi:hypothetical protein